MDAFGANISYAAKLVTWVSSMRLHPFGHDVEADSHQTR